MSLVLNKQEDYHLNIGISFRIFPPHHISQFQHHKKKEDISTRQKEFCYQFSVQDKCLVCPGKKQ